MKTSELIKKLQDIIEQHGDNDLRFTAHDYFTSYGREITTNLKTDCQRRTMNEGYVTNSDTKTTTIQFWVSTDMDGKKPKIIFRK